MKSGERIVVVLAAWLAAVTVLQAEVPQSRPAATGVDGVWKLEKIVYASGAVETRGGFIFLEGHYSTTVNFSHQGTQTNISQFGTYSLEGSRLVLVPLTQVSTRAQSVIYEPEPPFTLETTLTGEEMRGVALKDGTTFVFRRIR